MVSTVRHSLEASRSARTLAALDLGAGRAATIWENRNDRVRYEAPEGHAFSLYLTGGDGTRRVDHGTRNGRAGTVCILPEGQDSEWEITASFRFVHLYLSDETLRSAFSRIHDRDARWLDLPEATFVEMPDLASPLARLADAALAGDHLGADMAVADLVAGLDPRPCRLSGGLPDFLLRRIDAWIETHLDGTIRLADLARLAGLSDFHLHRMFRLSRGVPPNAWIACRRIERAKALLRTATPIAEIAAACGFSSVSHLTRVFKAQTGGTPAAYRRAMGPGGIETRGSEERRFAADGTHPALESSRGDHGAGPMAHDAEPDAIP
ncbi:AraC family transcriptional regulator [Fulvimarina endophytica]|uniref:AraC family transcriptional regulator n=1 Tax=Fulvimarina endophytica TaxID=2293836 RepID=A0A371X476_9HYPH|nr:AraC family transcriptional regulator [Fulvimarina endophytica]